MPAGHNAHIVVAVTVWDTNLVTTPAARALGGRFARLLFRIGKGIVTRSLLFVVDGIIVLAVSVAVCTAVSLPFVVVAGWHAVVVGAVAGVGITLVVMEGWESGDSVARDAWTSLRDGGTRR